MNHHTLLCLVCTLFINFLPYKQALKHTFLFFNIPFAKFWIWPFFHFEQRWSRGLSKLSRGNAQSWWSISPLNLRATYTILRVSYVCDCFCWSYYFILQRSFYFQVNRNIGWFGTCHMHNCIMRLKRDFFFGIWILIETESGLN